MLCYGWYKNFRGYGLIRTVFDSFGVDFCLDWFCGESICF